VQNATSEALLGGRASCAVVKPLRAGALPVLQTLYRRLVVAASGGGSAADAAPDCATLLRLAGADTEAPRTAAAVARAPIVGHTVAQKGGVAADDVHIGLTHNDVLQRLLAFAAAGRAGNFLPEGFRPETSVSASDTIVRGVPLSRGL
jgi:hypothetical protein